MHLAEHLANAVAAGLILLDEHGCIQLWNRWMGQRCRTRHPSVAGKPLMEVLNGPLDRRVVLGVREALDLGLPSVLSYALHPCPFPVYASASATERIKQSVTIAPVASTTGKRWCLIQISDVTSTVQREELLRRQARCLTERLQRLTDAQEQLRHSEMRFRELTRQAAVGMFEADVTGRITFANERWQELTGQVVDEMRIEPWHVVAAIEDRAEVQASWTAASATGQRFRAEFRCMSRSSMRKFWISVDAVPVRSPEGIVTGYVGTGTDIHESKQTALRNAHQATFDALTGLYNRAPFNERLASRLQTASPDNQFAVLFLDLDGFKNINDEHGHEAGDVVLQTAARRLRRALRADDVVARFGGDEFVVMLSEHRTERDLELIVAKVERAISQPINVGACHVRLTCSVGTAIYPDDGCDATSLMRSSDAHMYTMKRAKRASSTPPLNASPARHLSSV